MRRIFFSLIVIVSIGGCRFGNKSNSGGNERIVCVSKQLTELLFALHQGNKIVGLDESSTYPPEATKLTTVGYHRLLNAEGIISLDPTVVVHQGDVAPPNVMPQLKEVGIPVKIYPAAPTIDSTKYLINLLAKEYGQDTAAKRILNKLDSDLAKADSVVKRFPAKPRVLILHFGRQRNQYFVMGTRGAANEMIKLAGGVNAADTTSFRNLSPEAILRTQPDVILATDYGYDRLGSKEKFADLPGIALTPAYKNGKIYRVEEHDLVYFGPRSGEVILKFAQLIHQ
ncbi:MAG TPA: ABC transporter substrate-binding protein [Flavisolibacter sp.]|nr:ABC transporter substrate-binding protein [Flavisolibacter sp.]